MADRGLVAAPCQGNRDFVPTPRLTGLEDWGTDGAQAVKVGARWVLGVSCDVRL